MNFLIKLFKWIFIIIIGILIFGWCCDIVQLTSNKEDIIDTSNQSLIQKPKKDSTQIAKEANAYHQLKISHDEIEGYYWYKNSHFTHYIHNDGISLYIGKHNKSTYPFMRLKISSVTPDFFGLNHIILYYDGQSMDLPIDYFKDRNFESNGYSCKEWVDIHIKDNYISFLEKLADSNVAKIRFKGNTSVRDYTITNKEKKAISQVILGYNHFFNN
jgi:hypothetical protein